MALDGDEFFNCQIGNGTVQDLIAANPGAYEILVNWRIFGSSGHRSLSDDLVTERFVMAERQDRILESVIGFKSLFRTDIFKRPGIHRAKPPVGDDPRVVNASGLGPDEIRMTGWRSTDPLMRKNAQINHYAVRDAASFALKSVRGSASHPKRNVNLRYWRSFNVNDEVDNRLARRAGAVRAKMAALDDMTKGRLMYLRAASLGKWRDALEVLLGDDGFAAVFDELR